MKRVATIILNRNLPEPTNRLFEHLKRHDEAYTDIYVLEAGSDEDKLSKYCTWHASSPQILKNGLRYSRGMNYGLLKLWNEGNWEQYDAIFLITNDTELTTSPSIPVLLELFDEHSRAGIISPCSKKWGERFLLEEQKTKYFWYIHNNAYFLRREFIEDIMVKKRPTYNNFLFDGSNFRGCFSESELIAKGYVNDWAAAITTEVFAEENETYLLERADLIKTEIYRENIRLYVDEGTQWLRDKYGFNSRWSMQHYVKSFYDSFFEFHPEYLPYKI